MHIKRMVRNALENLLERFGGNAGYRMVREISYSRDGRFQATAWGDSSTKQQESAIDLNFPIEDRYCPFCNNDEDKKILVDQVRELQGVATRKIIYTCPGCNFAFTNEKRGKRSDYFNITPYADDLNGRRRNRELDLAKIGLTLTGLSNNCNILVYGTGNTDTRTFLIRNGFQNVWASDVAENTNYDEFTINTAKQPNYFSDMKLKFDVIIAVEVWEHYSLTSIPEAFEWLFRHVSTRGLVLATTSLWYPQNSDPVFNASKEFGIEQLKWWHYPHFLDHTSFYTEKNISEIAANNKCVAQFAYFSDKRVHLEDPFKRIICVTPESNSPLNEKIQKKFSRQFLDVFYC
jgi:hypothetical protein